MANKFGMGWVKDPVDKRDYNIRKLLPEAKKVAVLPTTFTVYPNTIIYDQGQTPRCVAYASSGVKTDEEFLQYGQQYMFDADWLYSECKKIDGIPFEDGTYPRVACQILQEKGDVLANSGGFCGFFSKLAPKTPDLKWKIDSYYRIDNSNSDTDIKQILFNYGSFLASSRWYTNWSDRFEVFPYPNGNTGGGHCYRIIGWDTTGWLVANSWGLFLWGKMGKAIMPFDIFRNSVLSEGDCWKLIDAK